MNKEICKHEWVGIAWRAETQHCKHCGISWYEVFPKVEIKPHHDHYWGVDYIADLSKTIAICRTCGEIKA